MNRIAILQPSFLPWLGFFDQMSRANAFVYLDDAQFTRRDWRNRNRIRTRDGWMWLTVPVINKNNFAQCLTDTAIDNESKWQTHHLNAIKHNYGKTVGFDLLYPELENIYSSEWKFLVDLCFATQEVLCDLLTINTPVYLASEFARPEKKDKKILALCQALQADHYLTGDAAKDYISPRSFEAHGIQLEFQNYQHPEYPQQYGEFISHLSVIDLIFNCGEASGEYLKSHEADSAIVAG